MRKIAPLAAIALFAALASSVPAAAQATQDLNKDTTAFMKAASNPYAATATPVAAPGKMHRKHHSKKKM
jgi:hypothetical protein